MAKEFKDFDKQFRHLGAHKLSDEERAEARQIIRWDMVVQQWGQKKVQYCVYEHETHLEWQQFRVQLKGLTTQEKLYMLKKYYVLHCWKAHHELRYDEWAVNKCRIDNYIGALVRGGQLHSSTYLVLK